MDGGHTDLLTAQVWIMNVDGVPDFRHMLPGSVLTDSKYRSEETVYFEKKEANACILGQDA